MQVFFNNHQVFATEPAKLNSDFTVNFGSIFRIVINQWPENLRVSQNTLFNYNLAYIKNITKKVIQASHLHLKYDHQCF